MRLSLSLLGALIVAGVAVLSASLILGDEDGPRPSTIAPPSAAGEPGLPAAESDVVAGPPDCRFPPELLPPPGASSPDRPPSSTPEPPPPDATPVNILPPECAEQLSHDVTVPGQAQIPSFIINGVPIYLPGGTRLLDYRAVTDQNPANPPPPIIELWVGQSWVKFNVQEGVLLESDVKLQDAETLQPLLEALKRP